MERKHWGYQGQGEQGSLPTAHREPTDRHTPPPRLPAHLAPGPHVPAPRHLTGAQAAGSHVWGAASQGTALLTGSRARFLRACPVGLPTPEADHRTTLDSGAALG